MCDTLAATTEARKAAAEDEDDEDDCAEAPAAVASASAQATSPLDSVSKVLTNSESELDEEVGPCNLSGRNASSGVPASHGSSAGRQVAERPVAVEAVGFDLSHFGSAQVREADACSSDASTPPSPLGTLEDRDLGKRLWARRAANKKRNKAAVPGRAPGVWGLCLDRVCKPLKTQGPRHVTSVSWQTVRGELHCRGPSLSRLSALPVRSPHPFRGRGQRAAHRHARRACCGCGVRRIGRDLGRALSVGLNKA